MVQAATGLALPPRMSGLKQIRQCIRSLELLRDQLVSEVVKVRGGVTASPAAVRVPVIVEELLRTNKLQLRTEKDVENLKRQLADIAKRAPRLRFTFASEPTDEFLDRLVGWLRREVNLYVLVEVAISPYIGGGFKLQTPTRLYDLSWRHQFEGQANSFTHHLQEASDGQ